MKSLISYIIEDKQTYDFRVKIANTKLDNDVLDRIEHALAAYELASMSKPKSLPIKDQNLDFPALKNCEVEMILVSLKYPCTDEQLRTAIAQHGRLPLASIVVTPKNHPEELMRDEMDAADETTDKNKAPILTKELEQISGGQIQVGLKRVESLLKELEAARTKTKTTNDLPQNNTSVIGKGRK